MSSVTLRSIGSFHIGGRAHVLQGQPIGRHQTVAAAAPREIDPNGDYVVGQMYAQEYRLSKPTSSLPVLLWHGGGMTGSQWESTPDGRAGWLWRFLAAGYDVVVTDAVERGRASWAPYPQIYAGPPIFRTKQEAWSMFRLGPESGYASDASQRRPFDNQQFPVHAFDAFAQQWVPRWSHHEEMALAAYGALVQRIGPCVVVAHSQGGGFACDIAKRCPTLVRAVVAIEPAGVGHDPGPNDTPHLLLWADHFQPEHRVCGAYRDSADRYWHRARQNLLPFDTLDLPARGIAGNSHFPMLDLNSDQIFNEIARWLNKLGL
ncbi:esterase [uncultured Variovorax sp.]|uniref:esterase n=1 Tax=uncultured Variovorax sp. TaxID=114708 RepID=UPI0025F1606F|nr:esterase [uncultured Variovorax sp.]